MTIAFAMIGGLVMAAPEVPLPDSNLLRVERALHLCQNDIPAMQGPADEAAQRIADGGALYAGGYRAMVSELCGRAGGIMLIDRLKEAKAGDVVLYAQDKPGPLPDGLAESGALVIAFGSQPREGASSTFLNHAQEAGISPTLANAIPGWLFTGELVAALTRLGKMPVMYETIGMYGGFARIDKYKKKGILWHEKHDVPPIAPGVFANRYVDTVSAMLRRVESEQRQSIDKVGGWVRDAKANGGQVIMYSMGHLFPDEIANTAIGELFESANWNSGFMQAGVPDHTYAPGDLLVHIGYQHPPYRMLAQACPAGARVAYVDVLQHRDYADNPNVVWIDPMWDWQDACVPVEGYDIAIIPASGIVNGAIAWEIYRVSQ
jgi:hypothetical protein